MMRQAFEERLAAEEEELPEDLAARVRSFLHLRRRPVESEGI